MPEAESICKNRNNFESTISASTFSDFSSVVARCLRKAPEIRLAKLCSPFAQASSDAT